VFSSFNQTAVYHARNLLENEGVATQMRNTILSSAMGELPPAECQAELWVQDEDAQAATAILQRRVSGPDWACGACGETSAAQFTQCWRCGADRPG
jgi:hypothetical protein